MKKTRLLLAIIAACFGPLQGAWAERVAPTMPNSVTPESGQTYYVFNTDAEQFLSNYNSISIAAADVQITVTEGRGTQFKVGSNIFYASSSGGMSYTTSTTSSYTYWIIADAGDGTSFIQCSPYNTSYYNEAEYMGVKSSSTELKHNCSVEDNVHWKFFTVEDGQRYRAELRLYKALNTIEAYGKEWYIENYKSLYDDRANQTADDLWAAAIALEKSIGMSAGYQAPWWNERPILFNTADGNFGQNYNYTWALPNNSYTSGSYFRRHITNNQSSISATVLVEKPSTLVYGLDGGGTDEWIRVYIDGTEVRALCDEQYFRYPSSKTHTRFFEELEPGLHTITWTCTCSSSSGINFYLYDVSVMSKQQITVSLLEPGSLGTEVLYNTDHIKNVRRLKVKGAMNNDDWGRIKMMSTLLELDLSEAQFTEIPANQFKVSSSDTTMNFLHKVVLPEGLTTIGDYAFHHSFVEDINLPSTMKRVGREAFYRSHVKELIMPDDMTDFYGGNNSGYCFSYMSWLKKLVLPKNLTVVPQHTFYWCPFMTEAVMSEKLQTIEDYGFYTCYRMQTTLPEGLTKIGNYGFSNCPTLNSPLPSTLTTIGARAFQYARGYNSIVIPQNVTNIGEYAFADCTNMETAELGVNQYSLAHGIFQNCSKLKTVKLNSPTVTTISSTYPLSDITTVTIQVPHYLVNEYKLHSYWYNAKAIEPFDYSTIDYIPIHGNLTLNHERFGGQPSIQVFENCYLKINGDAAQQLKDITIPTQNNGSNCYYGQILNNCDQITANGENKVRYRTDSKKWYFVSLPFDLDVSRIYPETAGTQYAIRYYDGAGRAANGKSGNWKNVDRTGIIPAGTGFIFQTNIAAWTYFYAADTENKYGTLRTTEFNKTLEVNASETTSNRGWNLVGNPYQCFYNNHCLNFTAPITVWNGSTYVAYSLTDDDYAIRPNEAFFVQCPNEEYNTIGFPLQGRQLTSVIESQNAARAATREVQTRKVVNLTISDGEWEDQTRVVLNEEASEAYETACDASKFMSMDNSVPQIYTMDTEGTQYAINERSLGEGTVALGYYAGQTGVYTISVTRCNAGQVFITDNLTGETADITDEAYTFSANAGTNNSRFTLSFAPNTITDIKGVDNAENDHKTEVYSIDGRFLGNDVNGLGAGTYILRQGKNVSKVIVR